MSVTTDEILESLKGTTCMPTKWEKTMQGL